MQYRSRGLIENGRRERDELVGIGWEVAALPAAQERSELCDRNLPTVIRIDQPEQHLRILLRVWLLQVLRSRPKVSLSNSPVPKFKSYRRHETLKLFLSNLARPVGVNHREHLACS